MASKETFTGKGEMMNVEVMTPDRRRVTLTFQHRDDLEVFCDAFHLVRARDGIYLPRCDLQQYERGDRQFREGFEPHQAHCSNGGEWCPVCDTVHCAPGCIHQYNDDDYCINCGADGRA